MAITEYFSIYTDMSWMGGRAGSGGWPGVCIGGSSSDTSDISTYSRSRIFLAIFRGRMAAGLYGPRVEGIDVGAVKLPCGVDEGGLKPALVEEATEANRCSPVVDGVNVGRVAGRLPEKRQQV